MYQYKDEFILIDCESEVKMSKAPEVKKIEKKINQHGHELVDHYAWMRDKNWKKFIGGDLDFDNPGVKAALDAENAYTEALMADTKDMQKQIYDELLSRIKEDDSTYPEKRGADYYYYVREEQGKNYAILCRKKGSLEADEEIFFDINKEAEGKKLYIFGPAQVSRDSRYLAYCYNLTGSMERTLKVRDLSTGKDFDWEIGNLNGSLTWIDNENLYFIERDETSRGKKIFKINVTKGLSSKELVFEKPDEYSSMFMGLGTTNDREYFVVAMSSGSTEAVFLSKKGTDKFEFFALGENDVNFEVDHYKDHFYVMTNKDGAEDYKVMQVPVNDWSQSAWEEFIPETKDECLTSVEIYNDYLVLEKKNNHLALTQIDVCHLPSKDIKTLKMPSEAYDLSFVGAWDNTSTKVRVHYNSPIEPSQVLELDLENMGLNLLKQKEVPNFDSSQYEVKREFAKARDGAEVPCTIVYKKGTPLNGENKAFVYAYGSYGIGMPAFFRSSVFSLIDRGYVFSVAHIRGGDDKGYNWYLQGKMRNKMNTFYDFIDCCEHLIQRKYTAQKKIAINGGSAGGMLMGAVTNLRPDLFGSVVADVAFVDVINTISDDSLPLTPPEWEEWGNPITNKEDFEYIKQYSPYDNVEAKDYPPMLYNSGISDEQVTYWEPAKMVAKLRALKTDNNPVMLHMKMHAGHAGASKKYEGLEEIAFKYAFILKYT